MPSPLALAAADYLNRGLRVIALTGKTPNGKVHRHGKDEPLIGAVETDEDWTMLAEVFDHPDTTGIGALTGLPHVVVDIDGPEGAEQWKALAGEEYMPDRWVARTGRGLHLWYAVPWNLRVVDGSVIGPNTIKLASKLDLKGFGGYVAMPPSRHPDGHLYEWLLQPTDEEPPMEAPEALSKVIALHVADLAANMVSRVKRKTIRQPRYAVGDTVFYAQLGYEAVIDSISKAEEGNRNNMLHWAAMTLAEEGGIDEDFIRLREAALAVGLEREEVTRTIRSARGARGA